MDISGSSSKGPELEVRKLRKKLRQIENLERLDRSLSDEERTKVSRKFSIRDRLNGILVTLSTNLEDSTEGLFDGDISINEERDAEEEYEERDRNESASDVAVLELNRVVETSQITLQEVPVAAEDVPIHSEKKSKTEVKEARHKLPKKEKRDWRKSSFTVKYLEGHNDLVTAVEFDGTTLLTASRDTTIKSWDIIRCKEIQSFGGHTGYVTSVVLLPKDDIQKLNDISDDINKNERVLISGSMDCSFRIWALSTGKCLKSIYTYNPITKLVYHSSSSLIITGSDGGKIELWDAGTMENIQSIRAHEESITGLQCDQQYVYSSCSEGILKVFEIRERNLFCVFETENMRTASGSSVCQRYVRSIIPSNNNVFYGDDGVNIKVLDWKKGLISKLPNHAAEFGTTDALSCCGDLMFSSSYDLDSGLASINVRNLDGEYLFTLDDEDTDRIVSLSTLISPDGKISLVTGGLQLKLWCQVSKKSEDTIHVIYNQRLAGTFMDSEEESESEFSDEESGLDELGHSQRSIRRKSSQPAQQSQAGWLSWCNIL